MMRAVSHADTRKKFLFEVRTDQLLGPSGENRQFSCLPNIFAWQRCFTRALTGHTERSSHRLTQSVRPINALPTKLYLHSRSLQPRPSSGARCDPLQGTKSQSTAHPSLGTPTPVLFASGEMMPFQRRSKLNVVPCSKKGMPLFACYIGDCVPHDARSGSSRNNLFWDCRSSIKVHLFVCLLSLRPAESWRS